jgi:group I intron endonuclease
MNIYTIYTATNKINGKNYIGFDSKWPKRKYEHHYNSTVGSSNQVFYNAIRKYGWDNFEWNIIYQSHDAEHTLTVMENHFINEYRSYIHFENSNGYNMTLGGEGTVGHIHTLETRNNISNALLGKTKGKPKPPRSAEHCANISKSKRNIIPWNKGKTGLSIWNKGKTGIFSDEQLQNLRNHALGRDKGKVWYNDGINEYFIFPHQTLDAYIKGRIKKSRNMKSVNCPHCGISGSGGNMTRYHFDNCKDNKKGT